MSQLKLSLKSETTFRLAGDHPWLCPCVVQYWTILVYIKYAHKCYQHCLTK